MAGPGTGNPAEPTASGLSGGGSAGDQPTQSGLSGGDGTDSGTRVTSG